MILTVIIILAAVLAVLFAMVPFGIGGSAIILWELPLAYLIGFILMVLLAVIFTCILPYFFDKNKTYETVPAWIHYYFHRVLAFILFALNFHVKVEEMEKLENVGPCLIVQNHRSMFDAVCSLRIFEKLDPVVISKPENVNVPVLGPYMHRLRYLAIDREDPRKAMKTIMEAGRMIKEEGKTVIVYPEGTRNKNFMNGKKAVKIKDIDKENWLLPFHNGVFKIAQIGNCPLVITTMEYTETITQNAVIFPTKMHLSIDRVIPAEEVKKMKTGEMGDLTREVMTETMNKTYESMK